MNFRFGCRSRVPKVNRKTNGWKTSDKKPVKNEDLWRELDQLASRHRIRWRWVRGHDDNPGNERADELANQGVILESAVVNRPPS